MPAKSNAFEFTFTDRPTKFTSVEVLFPGVILGDGRNTVPLGQSLTYYSQPVSAGGYYGRNNQLYTVTATVQHFTGTISLQGSLGSDPEEIRDYFDIPDSSWTTTNDLTTKFHSHYVNFSGNYTFIRAKVVFSYGVVSQILYNF